MLHNYVVTDRQMYEQAWFVLSACQLNTTPEIYFLEKFVFFKKLPAIQHSREATKLHLLCWLFNQKGGRGKEREESLILSLKPSFQQERHLTTSIHCCSL